jgi:hypothetical protein
MKMIAARQARQRAEATALDEARRARFNEARAQFEAKLGQAERGQQ